MKERPMGESEATHAENAVRAGREAEAKLRDVHDPERRVSELEGAQRFLQTMISEAMDAAMALQSRLSPLLQSERSVKAELNEQTVDPRSEFVRTLTEQGERVRDIASVLRDALDRLDV